MRGSQLQRECRRQPLEAGVPVEEYCRLKVRKRVRRCLEERLEKLELGDWVKAQLSQEGTQRRGDELMISEVSNIAIKLAAVRRPKPVGQFGLLNTAKSESGRRKDSSEHG